jgi:tetratricopeptide (TPR) repeat protein
MTIERGLRAAATGSRLASGLPQAIGSAILRAEDKNGVSMRILLIVIATLLGLAVPAWADAQSEINAGNAASNSGDLNAAIAHFTTAIELKSDYAFAYYGRGGAYFGKGLDDQAIADYTKAIELKPDLATAYSNRGLAYENLRQRDEAIADYRQALSLAPNMKSAHDGLKRLGAN